jgi:hypothetical protein
VKETVDPYLHPSSVPLWRVLWGETLRKKWQQRVVATENILGM